MVWIPTIDIQSKKEFFQKFLKQNRNPGFPTKEINGYGKDIDSFTECGIYTTANAAPLSSGMKNYPINSTGNIMVVKSNRQLTQFYITHDGLLYIRVKFSDGAYSKWRTVSISK